MFEIASFRYTKKVDHLNLSFDKLLKKVENDKTGYEVLYGACIPYYDFEKYYNTLEDQQNNNISDYDTAYNSIHILYKKEYDNPIIHAFEASGVDSQGRFKNSYHFRVRNVGYLNQGADVCKIDMFDNSVYKKVDKRQLIRLPFCSKEGEDRPLKSVKDPTLLIEHLIQYIDTENAVCKITSSINKNTKLKTEKKCSGPELEVKIYTSENIDKLIDCINYENNTWDYDTWIKFIWGLRNMADSYTIDLRPLAHKVSFSSDKYVKLDTDAAYDTNDKNTSDNPIGIATFVEMAKSQNPKMYTKWKRCMKDVKIVIPPLQITGDYTAEFKLITSEWTDGDVGDYVIERFGDILYADGNDLYIFKKHFWVKMFEGDELMYIIDNKIYKKLIIILELKKKEDPNNCFVYQKLTTIVTKSLRSVTKKKNYILQIMRTLGSQQVKIEFDANPNLVCFENGVYDLGCSQFRDGCRNDFITQHINYEYSKSTDDEKDKLMNFIKKILPVDDIRKCFLTSMSTCIYGKMIENIFILTGRGRNGKDTLITNLLNKTLGKEYYYNNNCTVITQNAKSGICQEKANMHKKRCIVYNEPSKAENLKCANLKEISGCPELSGRAIYSTQTTITNHSTNIVLANRIPLIDNVDEAIAHRLLIFPFDSIFITQENIDALPIESRTNVHLVNPYYKTNEFLEQNKLVFMNILIEYFNYFKTANYTITNIPQSMRDLQKAYLVESDEFLGWFNSEFEKTDNLDDVIKLKNVYTLYKNSDLFINLNKADKRRNNYESLVSKIKENPNLKLHYLERKMINRVDYKNILVRHKIKEPDNSDSDNEGG